MLGADLLFFFGVAACGFADDGARSAAIARCTEITPPVPPMTHAATTVAAIFAFVHAIILIAPFAIAIPEPVAPAPADAVARAACHNPTGAQRTACAANSA